jgi:hypothetical protein
MQIDSYSGAIDATAIGVLTANTKENFFRVGVFARTWKAWIKFFNGKTEKWYRPFKCGEGAIAKAYLTAAGQAYKAQYMFTITPIGA